MYGIKFCPKCDIKILPMVNGLCPSCRYQIEEESPKLESSLEKQINITLDTEYLEKTDCINHIKRIKATSVLKCLLFSFFYFTEIVFSLIVNLLRGLLSVIILLSIPWLIASMLTISFFKLNGQIIIGILVFIIIVGLFLFLIFISWFLFIKCSRKCFKHSVLVHNHLCPGEINRDKIIFISKSIAKVLNITPFDLRVCDGYALEGLTIDRKKILLIDPRLPSFLDDNEMVAVVAHEYAHYFKSELGIPYNFLTRCNIATKFLEKEITEGGNQTLFGKVIYSITSLMFNKELVNIILFSMTSSIVERCGKLIRKIHQQFQEEFHRIENLADTLSIAVVNNKSNLSSRCKYYSNGMLKVSFLQLMEKLNKYPSTNIESKILTRYTKWSSCSQRMKAFACAHSYSYGPRTLIKKLYGIEFWIKKESAPFDDDNPIDSIGLWNKKMLDICAENESTPISCVSLSPDGKSLAKAYSNGEIEILDTSKDDNIKDTHSYGINIRYLCFSWDNKTLAVACDKELYIFDTIDKQMQLVFTSDYPRLHFIIYTILIPLYFPYFLFLPYYTRTLLGSNRQIRCTSFSHDGRILAIGYRYGKIVLLDTKTKDTSVLKGHSDDITCLTFSSNDGILASASCDRTVRLWDTKTGLNIKTLTGHSNIIHAISFSPDDKILSSASTGKIILWEVSTQKLYKYIALKGTRYEYSAPTSIFFSSEDQPKSVTCVYQTQIITYKFISQKSLKFEKLWKKWLDTSKKTTHTHPSIEQRIAVISNDNLEFYKPLLQVMYDEYYKQPSQKQEIYQDEKTYIYQALCRPTISLE